MVIRDAQMSALRSCAERAFEGELRKHVKQLVPELVRNVDEETIGEFVHNGVQKAYGYRLTTRGPIRLFVELLCLAGFHFDTDPQFTSFVSVLTVAEPDEGIRAELLYDECTSYFDTVAGPLSQYFIRALRAVASWMGAHYQHTSVIADIFKTVYPEKSEYIAASYTQLRVSACRAAAVVHVTDPVAIDILFILMFLFGHGILDDPLYPWARRVFTNINQKIGGRTRLIQEAR